MRREKNKILSKKNLMTFFIVLIMISSVVGYMWGRGGRESSKYNGYSFLRKDNKWILRVNREDIEFDFFPSDVEDINISSGILNRFLNTIEIDCTYDADNKWKEGIGIAQYGLEKGLGIIGIYLRRGLTDENNYGLPIIRCEDATIAVPVLYLKESNQTKIWIDENCVIAEAKSEIDFIRIKDRLLYGMFGVIKNE